MKRRRANVGVLSDVLRVADLEALHVDPEVAGNLAQIERQVSRIIEQADYMARGKGFSWVDRNRPDLIVEMLGQGQLGGAGRFEIGQFVERAP